MAGGDFLRIRRKGSEILNRLDKLDGFPVGNEKIHFVETGVPRIDNANEIKHRRDEFNCQLKELSALQTDLKELIGDITAHLDELDKDKFDEYSNLKRQLEDGLNRVQNAISECQLSIGLLHKGSKEQEMTQNYYRPKND